LITKVMSTVDADAVMRTISKFWTTSIPPAAIKIPMVYELPMAVTAPSAIHRI
jgi:hypothetical protein